MCPDRKLEWFKNNGFARDEIRHLKAAVVSHWVKKYSLSSDVTEVVDTQPKGKVHSLLPYYNFV